MGRKCRATVLSMHEKMIKSVPTARTSQEASGFPFIRVQAPLADPSAAMPGSVPHVSDAIGEGFMRMKYIDETSPYIFLDDPAVELPENFFSEFLKKYLI